ncbi:MAG TPA: ElyC/SanA/YdcF family protein, partial [Desulfomonilia bacterium]|nr:ElyC/SanA/YdcF family protein [Desulfomonilia bacterium]
MFILKKIISPLLMPTTIVAALLTISVVMLWLHQRQKAAKIFITISCLLFMLLSYGVLSSWPLEKLENAYQPLDVKTAGADNIKWVVVLAGGDDESVVRLVEGIRIYRCLSGAKLLVSGGKVYASLSEPSSEKMAGLAVALGVKSSDIVQENLSRDTQDEARILRP